MNLHHNPIYNVLLYNSRHDVQTWELRFWAPLKLLTYRLIMHRTTMSIQEPKIYSLDFFHFQIVLVLFQQQSFTSNFVWTHKREN